MGNGFFVVILVVSLFFLLLSAEGLVTSAKILAKRLGISELLISLTVVAIGTSLPELVVAIVSILRGDVALTMGNIVGSNIINGSLIFGIAILSGNLRIGTQKTQRNAIVLMILTALFVSIRGSSIFPFVQGLLLVVIAFMIGSYQHELAKTEKKIEKKFKELRPHHKMLHRAHNSHVFFVIAFCLVGLAIAGTFFVRSLEEIAIMLSLSNRIVGLTISAISTTLPELLTTVVAMRKKEVKIAIGNILGSNIYNLSLIGGVISFYPNQHILSPVDIGFLLLSTFILVSVVRMWSGKVVPHWIGKMCIVLFVFFIVSSFLL